jgi:hypothetical protein
MLLGDRGLVSSTFEAEDSGANLGLGIQDSHIGSTVNQEKRYFILYI